MPIDPTNLLNIADNLFINASNEEGYRSSTSRAYYAAFHECCKTALKYHIYPTKKYKHGQFGHTDLHQNLINNNSGNHKNELIKIGYLLKQNMDLRHKADYSNKSFTRNQSNDALLGCGKIINLSSKL